MRNNRLNRILPFGWRLGAVFFATIVLGGAARAAELPELAAARVRADRMLIIAHRGHSSVAPENTLPAFESAIAARADLIELDYYHSADGVPVVFHDKTLDRTTNAEQVLKKTKQPVASTSLEELRRLDAGSWFDPKYAGAKILTLDEALDAIQAGSMTLIEHKGGDAATCVELLRKKELVDRVVVQSFNWGFLRDCHKLEPRLTLGALGSDELTDDKLKQIEACGARVVGWNHKYIGPREIARIHQSGKQAWVYTVNDVARARELQQAGLDGLITDRAAEMRGVFVAAEKSAE